MLVMPSSDCPGRHHHLGFNLKAAKLGEPDWNGLVQKARAVMVNLPGFVRSISQATAILLLFGIALRAQQYPGGEFFGGASIDSAKVESRANFFGWQISVAGSPLRRLRLVGDFGGQHRRSNNLTYLGERIRLENYQVVFGPQFTRRRQRTTLFTDSLVGVAATHYLIHPGEQQSVPQVDYGFAAVLGGGMDVNTGRFFAIRVFQADYLLTHLHHDLPQFSPLRNQLPDIGHWQSSFRLGFGLIFKLGLHGAR